MISLNSLSNFNHTASHKLTLTVLGGAIGFGLVLFLVFRPLTDELGRLHEQLQQQKDEYQQLVLEEASYRTAKTDFERISQNVEEITSLFPIRELLVGHVESLEAAAAPFEKDFILTIDDTSEEEAAANAKKPAEKPYQIVPGLQGLEVIPYNFTVKGSYLGMIRFLQTLEHQPFYSEIETLNLTGQIDESSAGPGAAGRRTGIVEARIRAAFYAKKN